MTLPSFWRGLLLRSAAVWKWARWWVSSDSCLIRSDWAIPWTSLVNTNCFVFGINLISSPPLFLSPLPFLCFPDFRKERFQKSLDRVSICVWCVNTYQHTPRISITSCFSLMELLRKESKPLWSHVFRMINRSYYIN